MARVIRLRTFLPVAQFGLAALLGGFGLWQRSAFLSQPLVGSQTLCDSTARFHVWPWPFKLAVILNMPAFLLGSLLSWPVAALVPTLPEAVQEAPSLVLVPVLWYWVGSRLDRGFGELGGSRSTTPWAFLLVFVLICLAGAFLPLGYVGYVLYGVPVWIAAGVGLRRLRRMEALRRANAQRPRPDQ